mmetsp:Transcript_5455/g.15629  ORF Transcript_5455/g.15629 Transcript_5455/m.15629 type:complete len:252 (+) Transcript_5455:1987-2742(+)
MLGKATCVPLINSHTRDHECHEHIHADDTNDRLINTENLHNCCPRFCFQVGGQEEETDHGYDDCPRQTALCDFTEHRILLVVGRQRRKPRAHADKDQNKRERRELVVGDEDHLEEKDHQRTNRHVEEEPLQRRQPCHREGDESPLWFVVLHRLEVGSEERQAEIQPEQDTDDHTQNSNRRVQLAERALQCQHAGVDDAHHGAQPRRLQCAQQGLLRPHGRFVGGVVPVADEGEDCHHQETFQRHHSSGPLQ